MTVYICKCGATVERYKKEHIVPVCCDQPMKVDTRPQRMGFRTDKTITGYD